ncbi:MAG: hypothetical protein RL087_839, partial [Pseudomonadota bacterium]
LSGFCAERLYRSVFSPIGQSRATLVQGTPLWGMPE